MMHVSSGALSAEYVEPRQRMVLQQLAERGIHDIRVLEAMGEVPRERFVGADLRHLAYEDCALPLADGQTISQPFMAAAMCEACRLDGHETVLEIGTGSGYTAAILSRLARRVVSVERQPGLAERAVLRLRDLGYTNVTVQLTDGTQGWPALAPYEVIVVMAGAPTVPEALQAQLAEGGRLVIPVGPAREQTLLRLTRQGDRFYREELMPCLFVPLIGVAGWGTLE
jgi:protein-L-isoaspartate(D-aspartate) O-methyltransferase